MSQKILRGTRGEKTPQWAVKIELEENRQRAISKATKKKKMELDRSYTTEKK